MSKKLLTTGLELRITKGEVGVNKQLKNQTCCLPECFIAMMVFFTVYTNYMASKKMFLNYNILTERYKIIY